MAGVSGGGVTGEEREVNRPSRKNLLGSNLYSTAMSCNELVHPADRITLIFYKLVIVNESFESDLC